MIYTVKVCFESRENMEGVLIVQSVISYDQNGRELQDYQNMVGNEYFGDTAENDAVAAIAVALGISPNQIAVEDTEFVPTPWDR